jgi:hypothetical protein
VGLELNGTHQLLVYADDENLVEDNIDIIKKNTQTSIDASKKIGLKVNTEKTKYILLSLHQNAGQNHGTVQIFGKDDTNQSLIQEEIKRRLNFGNACYHSVQNLLSSRLLSKNKKIRIYKTMILLVVLCRCDTWPLT